MEHAPELRELMLRFYAAVSLGDVDFLDQFLSHQGNVLMIGTDPQDWWATPTDMRQGSAWSPTTRSPWAGGWPGSMRHPLHRR